MRVRIGIWTAVLALSPVTWPYVHTRCVALPLFGHEARCPSSNYSECVLSGSLGRSLEGMARRDPRDLGSKFQGREWNSASSSERVAPLSPTHTGAWLGRDISIRRLVISIE